MKDAALERTVEFAVVPGDVRSFDADVLVLKHAGAFFGADKAVGDSLSLVGVSIDRLQPGASGYRYTDTENGIAAHSVLFVGVPPLPEFGYEQIRELAARALEILGAEAPDARHIATTVHGPGYGLDEVEAFLSFFDGCLSALRVGEMPPCLERISIVEKNDGRVERLRAALERELADADYATHLEQGWAYRLTARRMGHAALVLATTRRPRADEMPRAFVAMPFDKNADDVFYYGIQAPVRAAGFLCERVDQEAFTGDILDQVRRRIEGAAVIVADLSGANPNVYLEVGYAWGKGRPTVLLVKNVQDLGFDLRGQRCLTYESIRDLEKSLAGELEDLKSKGLI